MTSKEFARYGYGGDLYDKRPASKASVVASGMLGQLARIEGVPKVSPVVKVDFRSGEIYLQDERQAHFSKVTLVKP